VRLLSVPFFRQMDNEGGEGFRECASSACAMLAAFWGKVRTDDGYNRIRRRFGPSRFVESQRQALQSLGLEVAFTQRGTWDAVVANLNAGRPVCLPYLHEGPVTRPTGFGHWCTALGIDADQICIHDPMGEPALVGGGFVPGKSGSMIKCTRLNFGRRWSPEGHGNGWLLTAWDPGRAQR
jgi:hypothetical protein